MVKLNFFTQGAALNATSYTALDIEVIFRLQVPDTEETELLPTIPVPLVILNFSFAVTVAAPGALGEKVTAGVVVLVKEYASPARATAGSEPAGVVPAGDVAAGASPPPPPPPHAAKVAVTTTKENKVPNFMPTFFKINPDYQRKGKLGARFRYA